MQKKEIRYMNGTSVKHQNGNASHPMAVYFCVDTKFFPFALFLANQIATKYPQRNFDLCIISAEQLPETDLIGIHNIRLLQIDATEWAEKLPADERISFAAYLRIMAPALLADDYSRMLYLDADVFYQRGDLNRLLQLDLQGRPLGAVRDMIQLRQSDRIPGDFVPFAMPYGKYFNSGVLLIDVATWNAQSVTERALNFAADNSLKLMAHDQTALNVTLLGNWAEMSLVWNYEYTHQTMYFSASFDVCFYHFVGRRKPFNQRYGGFARRFTEEYRRFFIQYFPQLAGSIQNGLEIQKHRSKHILALMFHAVNTTRFLKNDDRFLSDWDIILGEPTVTGSAKLQFE